MTVVGKGDSVRAVGRALEILLAFTRTHPELSAGELIKRVDLSRSTLYRLLHTLEDHGFISSAGDPLRYRLGPSVARLSNVWQGGLDLKTVAEPVLRRIWRSTLETVSLFVLQGDTRLCIQELASPQPLSFKRGVGYTEHVARGATGKAILAFSWPTHEQLGAYTDGLGIDADALLAELGLIQRRGFALSRSELIDGAVALAVPFFDAAGRVAGSIGVFGPAVRLDPERQAFVARLLIEESEKLSQQCGQTTPAAVY